MLHALMLAASVTLLVASGQFNSKEPRMSTKKRILVTLIVAVLAAIVIFPMLPLEYRDRVVAILTHPLYYLGLGNW